MKHLKAIILTAGFLFLSYSSAMALETPIGLPQSLYGMEIAAVYLQAIEMEPKGIMKPRGESDIHLECDIRAAENNPNGFAAGEWIPNLIVHYTIIKLDPNQTLEGITVPLVANDGPTH